jgi:metal-responsive CopG/Arc/MetJ family transcriptional regulator
MDRGRPKIGNGSERINITIERDLLARADAIARQRKIGRSEMIASVLKLLISRKAS